MTEWMGRYRQLVAAIVQHTNVVMEGEGLKKQMYEDLYLSTKEWQVLEYIVEHRDDDRKMIHMSDALGIHQSYFSKITRSLASMGLVERFHSADNKKDVFLKPTEFALTVYDYHTKQAYQNYFKSFFDALEGVSDEDLAVFAKAVTALSESMVKSRQDSKLYMAKDIKQKLVKIE